ncbi:glycosyltransferase family protein [Defluviitalea phaphyphila]|uniref:glycosyltransferase family 1 protein n=1 Tax=Defluviitalea phaphyphila TaxID=1473580 RepID=UPI000731BF54|nr:glycosyltransferase family 1 protein [Defluviitalea phaphyphila]
MREKIYIIDSFRKGNEHEVVNGMLINMYKSMYKKVILRTVKSHYEKINKYIKFDRDINYRCILNIREINYKLATLLQYIIGVFYDIYYYIKAKEILFLTINPFSLFFIKFLNILLKKKVIFVCHGELDSLRKEGLNYFSIYYRFILILFRFIFNIKINMNIYYIILGESIKNNLLQLNPYYKKLNLIVIDHPYDYSETFFKGIKRENKSKNNTIKLGIVGVATKEKNSDKIFELADMFQQEIKDKKLEFTIVGKIKFNIEKYNKHNVKMPGLGKDLIEREEYERIVNELDYILFFYDKDSYKLIASGSFFDAIKMGKPIISIKNDFFNYYFSKYGDMGYLCDNINDMINVINNLLLKNIKTDVFKNNIKRAKNDLSYNNIFINLKNQMEKL